MKLLFLGCSWTYGCELAEGRNMHSIIKEKRYSTIIGKRLNADVINLAKNGLSNHAIARIFLEQDLELYDKIFVQMTLPSRTEVYDPTGDHNKAKIMDKMNEMVELRKLGVFRQIERLKMDRSGDWTPILSDKKRFMLTGNLLDNKEWWQHYYEEIYTETFGITEEMLVFTLIKNKLTRMKKDHLIFSINRKCKLPIDLQLNKQIYPRKKGNHPDELGHVMIASNIMKLL